ncbi:MAG: DUF3365 domain-containing protein [Planctomycetaceae bacterium]|nr:DUF3365 domain-containing protein [Planctomycetaceae bacterium]
MIRFQQLRPWLAVTLVMGSVVLMSHAADPAPDAAVARARKQAQMLDDLYKTAIVLITENYVEEDSDLAAGDAFQALFKAMSDKGYHEVRLLDATGEPYDTDNTPRKGFEQKAIKALKGGAATYEEVVEADGKRSLRIATAVPVVMKKCVMCHGHYADAKPGAAIGALSYTIPIE